MELVLLAAAAFLVATANGGFWSGALAGRDPWAWASWRFTVATFVALTALHFVAIGLVATRHTVRPLLAVLLTASAGAAYFMQHYGVVLDPSMLRNVLHTDYRESAELVGTGLALRLAALGLVPALIVWWLPLRRRPWKRALGQRLLWLAAGLVVGVGALLATFQDLGSLMRNQHTLRYTITPGNLAWSLGQAIAVDANAAAAARAPLDPVQRAPARPGKPTLMVMVVGETVRAANFGLSGYERQTTPQLAATADVVAFPRVAACGTSTEVSLPCMFSPFGRAGYDARRIRSHESVLQTLGRAGVRVSWRDNQSGCKGVCDGLEVEDLGSARLPGLCADGRCLDEVLLHGLAEAVRMPAGDVLVVMHQLGNHGPAYHLRYPPEFARFQPACTRSELRECSREEIVNAYDNAVLYTDHLLAQTIRFLQAQRDRYEVAMLYVSDHGESLGEHGLYLHGMPYSIAPREQREVPMVFWTPAESARALGLDTACLRRRAAEPASHDHLFHSLLGLFRVDTPRYRAADDLFAGCRAAG